MTDGFGAITWWGFSPALDLQDRDAVGCLQGLSIDKDSAEDLNVLLVGAGDVRHMLKTIAKSYKWQKRKINFYVLENSLELYARDMLLLLLAFEPSNRMGLQEKTELFLELFGNCLVRQQSMEYVVRMATMCIKMVTDFDYLEKKFPLLDLSLLKFKERDFLEGIFKFWRNKSPFDVKAHWEFRLRQFLGVRYDSRKGVFDWDYNMKLMDRGAEIIHNKLYAWWRETGTAFEIREGSYDVPNITLASGFLLKQGPNGDKVARRGYWGDIIVSPFIAFGVECEEKSFFKKANNQLTKTSCDVSEYNMLSLLHEVASKTKYVPPKQEEEKSEAKEQPGATLTEITEEEEEEETTPPPAEVDEVPSNPLDAEYESLPIDGVKVHFLPLNSIGDLYKKGKYQKLFNLAYFSNSMVHHMKPENRIQDIFSDKTSVILESTRFMLELKVEQNEEFVKRVSSMAEAVGCKPDGACNPMKDAFVKFKFERSPSTS